MKNTMKAAILVEHNKPLVIDDVELPAKLQYGQVLVKTYSSSICGSQLGEIDGVKGPDPYMPHLLGHEGTGIVVDCGEGVTTVKDGDRVVMHWRKGAGIQSQAPIYHSNRFGTINAGWVTTFNEFAVVSENRLTSIPDDFDSEVGALMGCAVTTGLGVINNNAKMKMGESIVVWGAGGVGLNIVQGAALVSAYPIIAIDLFDKKLDLARDMGATHTINAKKTRPEDGIFQILGKDGADVVVDNTGDTEIIHRAYELTKQRGRTILVGVPGKGNEAKIFTLPLHFGKELTGSHGGEAQPDIDIPNYIKLINAGILRLKGSITARYSLAQINEAIDDMRSGRIAGRAMLNINDTD